MNYPTEMFENMAKVYMLNAKTFPGMPIWTTTNQGGCVHPVIADYSITPQDPVFVKPGDEISVSILFYPRVRIEGVYYVTYNPYAKPWVKRYENQTESLVQDPDLWIKVARNYLPWQQIGSVAVTTKYRILESKTGNKWEVVTISDPTFEFKQFSDVEAK